MSTIINATTTNGVVIQPDNSGSLVLQTNNGTTAVTISTAQNATFAGTVSMSSSFLRNRIINGEMQIDQRNAGAATANTINDYTVDRWQVLQSVTGKLIAQQNAAAVTPPTGFTNYLGVTSQSSYSVLTGDYYMLIQLIEGYNIADLGWGTASAQTITLSFWVRSSLTGTFGGALKNNAANRSYPFTYSIPTANTWTAISVTIAGDTSGTWEKTTSAGIQVQFGLGVGSTFSGTAGAWAGANLVSATGATSVVGTNGATFYITGVQLEQNTSATPFERRLYNQELANCQRYFTMSFPQGTAPAQNAGTTGAITGQGQAANAPAYAYAPFKTTMRATPTITTYNPSAANANWRNTTASSDINVVVSNTGDAGTFIGSNTQVLNQYAICAIHYSATAEL